MSGVNSEKDHFDKLSRERFEHGFIPDLERMADCDYFYLSPFRRKALANLALSRSSAFLVKCLASMLPRGARVLDLGCGSGWFSLELARAGFHVTAVDLSQASIELARRTLSGADLSSTSGSVVHQAADLNEWQPDDPNYGAVCYVGMLHHLDNPRALVQRMHSMLPPGHYMIAQEPLPSQYGKAEAAVALLVRGILSAAGAWYERLPISPEDFSAQLESVRQEYTNWADRTEQVQSPMNNTSDGEANLSILEEHYQFLDRQNTLPLQPRLIGGIRLKSDSENVALARFITQIEEVLLASGAIKPCGCNIFGEGRPPR